ncbi:hypothetical protein [Streptosporangium amethystogenes]|nr:hypothetical protein [Streptosporangium amethystogenes]
MTVKAVPDGYSTVTPWITSSDTAKLMDYVKEASGSGRRVRVS